MTGLRCWPDQIIRAAYVFRGMMKRNQATCGQILLHQIVRHQRNAQAMQRGLANGGELIIDRAPKIALSRHILSCEPICPRMRAGLDVQQGQGEDISGCLDFGTTRQIRRTHWNKLFVL